MACGLAGLLLVIAPGEAAVPVCEGIRWRLPYERRWPRVTRTRRAVFGAIDFECVRSKRLLVVDGLCPHGIPPLTKIVHSDGSGGGYDS